VGKPKWKKDTLTASGTVPYEGKVTLVVTSGRRFLMQEVTTTGDVTDYSILEMAVPGHGENDKPYVVFHNEVGLPAHVLSATRGGFLRRIVKGNIIPAGHSFVVTFRGTPETAIGFELTGLTNQEGEGDASPPDAP
jgi:hypothetical protein